MNKKIWENKYKGKFLIHPRQGLMQITNGYTEKEDITKGFIKKKKVGERTVLSTIDVIYVNEYGEIYSGSYEVDSLFMMTLHGWMNKFKELERSLKALDIKLPIMIKNPFT